MSGHTPGPWIVDAYGDVTANGEDVARIASSGEEAAASDARLIDAAPDLLDALLDVMGWIPGGTFWHSDAPKAAMVRARSAIAKALGEQP